MVKRAVDNLSVKTICERMHECLYLYLLISNLILFSQLNAFYINEIPEYTYVLLPTVDSSSTFRFT
jgi:hypothetical protein